MTGQRVRVVILGGAGAVRRLAGGDRLGPQRLRNPGPRPRLAAPREGPVAELMFMLDHELRRRGLHGRSPIRVFSPGSVFFEDVGPKVHAAVRASAGLGDEQGFVPAGQAMRHPDFERGYAAGDGSALAMPKLGHIAVMQADIAAAAVSRAITGTGAIPAYRPEIFCIANRGGAQATLILSDTLFGGTTDLTLGGPLAHMMKWGFDGYYFHTRGHLPPGLRGEGTSALLRRIRG